MQVEPETSAKLLALVPFELDGLRCGLHLHAVERVLQSVSPSPLPAVPSVVLGIVDLHGKVIPVISLRRRFGLPDRKTMLTDQLIVAGISPLNRAGALTVALLVDSVRPVIEVQQEAVVTATGVVPGLEHIQGVARLQDGLLLIQDLDRCLSLEERRTLGAALETLEDE